MPSGSIEILKLTATIVAAHLSNNQVSPTAVPSLIKDVRKALEAPIDLAAQPSATRLEGHNFAGQPPAVRPEDSITDDYLICLEDGAKVRTLKRYLRRFNLTPDQYRAKWGLPSDYPMTAPNYSKLRRRWAKKLGLGTKSKKPSATRKASPKTS